MLNSTKEIVFVVSGEVRPTTVSAGTLRGSARAVVQVGASRAGGQPVRVAARCGQDVVVLSVLNGPTLVLHPEEARDLMLAQSGATKRSGKGTAPDEVVVPAQLAWPDLGAGDRDGQTRGLLGQVWLSLLEVITGVSKEKAAKLTAAAVTRKLDGRVEAGVYELSPGELQPLKSSGRKRDSIPAAANGGPFLVLVHGTFVDTVSTFGKLWSQHERVVQRLFSHYRNRVYALDHPTLGQSPIANALTLAQAMPKGARLHVVSHSRGGMVAEVLARVCGGGVGKADLALFESPGYAKHRADLKELVRIVKDKRLQVERVVRVACPSRGTLLAGKRLDAYLSVLKWGLERASIPVVPELIDFLFEVARRRGKPDELPGLEAMMPESPLVKWLNAPAAPLRGQLRVVAGDMQGDSIVSWVKTLLTDAFFWTDNDMVVQTRSMYGGTARAAEGASFVLDRGAEVTHFQYFANERSVRAIAQGLIEERPADFRPIGPLSWAGKDASGTRAALAATRSRAGAVAERPAVFVLPGILGSHLAVEGKRIWLSVRILNGLQRLAWDEASNRVADDGPIGSSYDDLIEHLAESHEVIPFGFDWRRPLEDEAVRLAIAVDGALRVRMSSKQPVRLVAHSMGGLLARTMQLVRPQVWQRMLARDGARVLMLGTPNGGSWAPMQVLSGDDTFGNLLALVGTLFDSQRARQLMAGMPGFIQLQAGLLEPEQGLGRTERWRELAELDLKQLQDRCFWHADPLQLRAHAWGVPSQAVLNRAVALRRKLDRQRLELGTDAHKLLLVVGHAASTPDGIKADGAGVEYLDAVEAGDGRVTHDSAMLPGVRTWKVDAAHGDLPDTRGAFAAYVDLLVRGETALLPPLRPLDTRGTSAAAITANRARVPTRVRRSVIVEPPSLMSDVFGAQGSRAMTPLRSPALPLSVLNSNLKFISQPLLLGHYVSTALTGAERVGDALLGGAMNDALQTGLYPSALGSQQVFINTWRSPEQLSMPRPTAIVVIGLGEEGRLRMSDLCRGVAQGVVAYAQRERERGLGSGPVAFELAVTLIGSGGTGVTVGSAAQAIAKGAREANLRLQRRGWPQLSHLHLVELYTDRASEAQHALTVLAEAHPSSYALTPTIVQGIGSLSRQPDSGYRGANYDFVTAVERKDADGSRLIEYTLDTQRARSEVRGQATQSRLVDQLIASGASNADLKVGRSLFQLLVPAELEAFLSGSNAVVLQLDEQTARVPWELLDSGDANGSERYPWAVRTQMLRKLRSVSFRENPVGASRDGDILVIGEPLCDRTRFAELPGAREEATAVAEALGTTALLGSTALQTVTALLDRPYRIVHIAGHGEHHGDGSGGVVLSNDTVLGPREIESMRTVPELVFINCCFLGTIGSNPDPTAAASPFGALRARFAASVAGQLIRIGVRCVVAAGWAVEDEPAKIFATRFYRALLSGERFIDAVGHARAAAWDARPTGNTWAAYQCYGDPDWRYRPRADADLATAQPTSVVSPEGLALMLQAAALDAQYQASDETAKPRREQRLEWIKQLESQHAAQWGGLGAVAEAFGTAYVHHGDLDGAVRWHQQAMAAGDAGASFRSAEQLANSLARRGESQVEHAKGRRDIQAAIGLLEQLISLRPTVERESLLGSAWKRLAMLESRRNAKPNASPAANGKRGAKGRKKSHADVHGNGHGTSEVASALSHAFKHYRNAERLAIEHSADNLYYPAMNAIAVELRLAFESRAPISLDPDRVAAVRQSLLAKTTRDPDFWSVAGVCELHLFEALSNRGLARSLQPILTSFRDLNNRVNAPWLWNSVAAQARFTVAPYGELASGPEKLAARQLLDELSTMAK